MMIFAYVVVLAILTDVTRDVLRTYHRPRAYRRARRQLQRGRAT